MNNFWGKNASHYDRFMKKDRDAYERMYALIRPVVKGKDVLEIATGTGLIAKNIIGSARLIEATDFSEKMIEIAGKDLHSAKLHFSVQNMFNLPYSAGVFDVVIISNALHVVAEPKKALDEIRRVLKDDGILIAPTFTHKDNNLPGKIKAFFMSVVGFKLYNKWSYNEYIDFLNENGWKVRNSCVLKASFPLTYAECEKKNI